MKESTMIILGAFVVICALGYRFFFREKERPYGDIVRKALRTWAGIMTIPGAFLFLWGLLDGRMPAVREVLSLFGFQ